MLPFYNVVLASYAKIKLSSTIVSIHKDTFKQSLYIRMSKNQSGVQQPNNQILIKRTEVFQWFVGHFMHHMGE